MLDVRRSRTLGCGWVRFCVEHEEWKFGFEKQSLVQHFRINGMALNEFDHFQKLSEDRYLDETFEEKIEEDVPSWCVVTSKETRRHLSIPRLRLLLNHSRPELVGIVVQLQRVIVSPDGHL